jgi:hypothetical protein
MSNPAMRITVDAAMRARDVSRSRPDGDEPAPPPPAKEPPKPSKNERRRLGKRNPKS